MGVIVCRPGSTEGLSLKCGSWFMVRTIACAYGWDYRSIEIGVAGPYQIQRFSDSVAEAFGSALGRAIPDLPPLRDEAWYRKQVDLECECYAGKAVLKPGARERLQRAMESPRVAFQAFAGEWRKSLELIIEYSKKGAFESINNTVVLGPAR